MDAKSSSLSAPACPRLRPQRTLFGKGLRSEAVEMALAYTTTKSKAEAADRRGDLLT